MNFTDVLAPSVFALIALSLTAHADTHEHHEHSLAAHVHGVATLNIALDEQQLSLELHSPAMNILGFEYTPSSTADKNKVLQAERTLKNEQLLFKLSSTAHCALSTVTIKNDLAEHADARQHNDILVNYQFNCARAENLTGIDLAGFFQAFPMTEQVNVQLLSVNAQQSAELSHATSAFSW